MTNKDDNKFHNMDFTIGHNDNNHNNNFITVLNNDLEKTKINDDFTNEVQLKYEYPVQGENAKNQLVDTLQESDSGYDYDSNN